MKRRDGLKLLTLSVIPISGCVSPQEEGGSTNSPSESPSNSNSTRTDTDEEGSETMTSSPCSDEYERIAPFEEISVNSWNGWELNAEDTVLGNELTVTLTNTKSTERTTNATERFIIQHDSGDGWESIYWADPPVVYGRMGTVFDPNSSYTWELDVSSQKIEHPQSEYSVCNEITPGKYRFVYFGMGEGNPAIAAELKIEAN